MRIWVRMKDHPTVQKLINEETFDEESMIKVSDDELAKNKVIAEVNMKNILTSRRAPGMFMKTDSSKSSTMHHGKLDEGATEELLDRGLEGAKKRALSRNASKGSSFHKVKRANKLRRKK